MPNDLILLALIAWLLAAILALLGRAASLARAILGAGAAAALAAAVIALPSSTPAVSITAGMPTAGCRFALTPDALWLLGFGLAAAVPACWLGPPARKPGFWIVGAAMSLIGALGVFGLHDVASFLIAWEIMSLGGAVMILGDQRAPDAGRPVLFMLGLLEAGTVALIVAFVLMASRAGSLSFADFANAAAAMTPGEKYLVGLLCLLGFGAKLGLLPFYEWFPGAYGAGSGASGALLSGVILNAAFFGLSRALLEWLPPGPATAASIAGIVVVAIAVLSAVLTALYAFQQEDWRHLLSLSSAENACIAVCLIGAAMLFRHDGLLDLASLAWAVALLHLAGHALAKGALFLAADGVFRAAGDYRLVQRGLVAVSPWPLGVGALFAAMSLAAMPPQAGFVSEWFLFQTFFQGFHLSALGSRMTTVLGGAGLALTVAIAFATYIKAFGIGLLGRAAPDARAVPGSSCVAVGALGMLVLALAVGMPVWIDALAQACRALFGTGAIARLHDGWLMVPLTAKFAFISPSKLVLAMPALALLPIALLAIARRRPLRRVPVWYGGCNPDPSRSATTALTFSNALRTFYSFVYRPTLETEREHAEESNGHPYFVRRLLFTHDVAPIFGPYLFAPLERLVTGLAGRLRLIQSGDLNFYLALIGAFLLAVIGLAVY